MEQKIKRAVGYTRVSSDEQVRDACSLERQEEMIRDCCKLYEYNLVEVITDRGVSGFSTTREGYCRLKEMIKNKEVDIVIVYDLSRLNRNVKETLIFLDDYLNKYNVNIHSVTQKIDTTTAMGKAMFQLISVFNEMYRNEISEKTKIALNKKRERGEKLGGSAPYGYNLSTNDKLVENPQEMKVIKAILYYYSLGCSYRGIASKLEALGIKTKQGKKQWQHQIIKGIIERNSSNLQKNLS